MSCRRRGFTLIELLVSVAIIAILSAISISIYGSLTTNARDARRKLDLQNIAQALEIYYQKNNTYPVTNWVYSNAGASWIPNLVPDFISSVPQDPKANGGNPWVDNSLGYAFCSDNATCYSQCKSTISNGQWFVLATQLENHNDQDRMELKDYKWCDGQSMRTVYNWSKYSFVVTPR